MPKRSTGCITCRLRKVKCDEQRPFCQRCIQYNSPCPGYATNKSGETAGFQFKDQTVRVAHRAETIYTAKARKHDAIRNDSKSPSSTISSFSSDEDTAMIVARSLPAFNTAPEMQVQLLSSFIHHYLPKEKELPSWFTFVAELPSSHSSNKLISTATNALCLSHHGAVYDDQKLVMEGNKAYLKSIELLAKALPRATGRESDNILAVVGALGICELFRGTLANGSGWQSHVAGSCQLIVARGPDSFDTPVMRQHFDNVRYAALVGGIVGRRPLFFAEPKWMRVTVNAPDATPAMALMDLAVQIPGLLVETDTLYVNDPVSAQEVLQKNTALLGQMRLWYAKHHEADPSTGIETVDISTMKQFVSVVPVPVFPKVLKYPSFNVASKHVHYWFYLFTIRKNELELYSQYSALLDESSSIPSEIVREINIYVTNICKSIPFLFESRSGSIGKISLFMSLDFCRGWLYSQGQWQELQWLEDVKKAIRNLGFCVPYVKPAENRIGPTFFDDIEEALNDPELQLLTAEG